MPWRVADVTFVGSGVGPVVRALIYLAVAPPVDFPHGSSAAEAARLVKAELEHFELTGSRLGVVGKGRWLEEKAVLAALARGRTGVRNRWVAKRLGMGAEGNVTRGLRRVSS